MIDSLSEDPGQMTMLDDDGVTTKPLPAPDIQLEDYEKAVSVLRKLIPRHEPEEDDYPSSAYKGLKEALGVVRFEGGHDWGDLGRSKLK